MVRAVGDQQLFLLKMIGRRIAVLFVFWTVFSLWTLLRLLLWFLLIPDCSDFGVVGSGPRRSKISLTFVKPCLVLFVLILLLAVAICCCSELLLFVSTRRSL
jgi:hypothetical protein